MTRPYMSIFFFVETMIHGLRLTYEEKDGSTGIH